MIVNPVGLLVHRRENMRLTFGCGDRSQMFFNSDYSEHKKF